MDKTKETIQSLLDIIQSTADVVYRIAYTKGGAYQQYADEFLEIDDFLSKTRHDLDISGMADQRRWLEQYNVEEQE